MHLPTSSLPRRIATIAVALAVTLPAAALAADSIDRTNQVRAAIEGGQAKNVILLIGDGLGDSEITIARNYTVGAGGRLAIDDFPLTGQVTTYSVLESDPSTPDYTPESASTATAWSTGIKTSDGRISTTPGSDEDVPTILELAKAAGYMTGDVTTSELTDATPAAPVSHVRLRGCQGPLNMGSCPQDRKSVGGGGSIAEQAVDLGVDVLLGGGKARFDQIIPAGEPNAGQTVLQTATSQGYTVVTDRAGLLGAGPGTKLLGLFNSGNMSMDWTGPVAANPPVGPVRCTEDQRPANEPSLAEMTATAIELLDQSQGAQGRGRANGRPGFFLQVESASIDKRDHVSQACEQIGETVNFDEAVRVALDYAAEHPDTLVIVTGDHAHTSQIVEDDATPAGFGIKLTTDEGGVMQVSYGTGSSPTSQEHTGSQIRVAAQGPQAANVVGLIDQTDLFTIMARALGVD